MGKRKATEQAAEAKEIEEQQLGQDQEQSENEEVTDDSDSGSEGSESDSSSDDDDSAPDVSDDEEDSPDEDAFDQINVDFQFFDPKESDFHGLKALLHTYLDGQQYDSSPLVDTIIEQSSVGTVVRTGEDEDPIGVMTVLNTQQYKQHPFMGQIKQYMLSKCKDTTAKEQLSKAWDAAGTGLLINERLVNSPPQLAPPLVQALFDEIGWATEDEPTQERRDFFKFKQYLLITRVYSDPLPEAAAAAAAAAGPSSGKPPAGPKKQQQQAKKRKGEQQQAAAPVIVYVRPEDEFFHQQAAVAFTFPIEGRAVAKDELQPMRLVMLLPAAKVKTARAALDSVIGNMAAQQQ